MTKPLKKTVSTKARAKVALKPNVKIMHDDKLRVYLGEQAPTSKQSLSLQDAYTHYNTALFNGQLPPVLVTFQRQRKSAGYYWPNKMISRATGKYMAEIALAINKFESMDDKFIFSILVHEMAHHWQQEFGTPSRNGYHNKEWANKMKLLGLYPSHNGQEGGNEIGQNMGHYIVTGGAFDLATVGLAASIDWNSAPEDAKKKKALNKVKYECPDCNDCNAWGKPNLFIKCGACDVDMEAVEA